MRDAATHHHEHDPHPLCVALHVLGHGRRHLGRHGLRALAARTTRVSVRSSLSEGSRESGRHQTVPICPLKLQIG